MTVRASPSIVEQVVRMLRERHRCVIPPYDEGHLAATIAQRLKAAGQTPESYVARLETDAAEAKGLVRSLLVTFSEFFRNPAAFAVLEQEVLPVLLKRKARERAELRVWSAACATGEEAWSMAILLHELASSRSQEPAYRILGSDVSEACLERARTGVYSLSELGNVRVRQLNTCFVKCGASFAIAPAIRRGVDFAVYDLLDEDTSSPPSSIYGNFDLIFCSNVLLYYCASAQMRMLEKVRNCLAPGGYLIASETERRQLQNEGGFRPVTSPAVVFQKSADTF